MTVLVFPLNNESVAQIFFRKKLRLDKTLGKRLKAARKKKKLTLEQAEEETKVRLKYLQAFEIGDYLALPADVYALGFLSKYADLLDLPKDEILLEYRREKGSAGEQVLPIKARIKSERFFLTPRVLAILGGVLLLVVLGGYIFYSIRHFLAPPNLEISAPSTQTVVRQDSVEVDGKTDIGCSLRINDQTVYIDNLGNFKQMVRLEPGINNIEVSSTNRVKKESDKVIQVLAEF